jgi:hypothetical protein
MLVTFPTDSHNGDPIQALAPERNGAPNERQRRASQRINYSASPTTDEPIVAARQSGWSWQRLATQNLTDGRWPPTPPPCAVAIPSKLLMWASTTWRTSVSRASRAYLRALRPPRADLGFVGRRVVAASAAGDQRHLVAGRERAHAEAFGGVGERRCETGPLGRHRASDGRELSAVPTFSPTLLPTCERPFPDFCGRSQHSRERPHLPVFPGFPAGNCHRGDRTRTCDPRFWRPMLYQLSYAPLRRPCSRLMVARSEEIGQQQSRP